jgi:hypothetical protein
MDRDETTYNRLYHARKSNEQSKVWGNRMGQSRDRENTGKKAENECG